MVDASMDPRSWGRKQLEDADPDLLRALLQAVLEDLIGTEVDIICNAAYGERTEERENSRNGYRRRRFDTRVGTIDLPIPKLRSGTYFPDWLLEKKKRAERALISIVADAYLAGVSTRRVDKLVKQLGIEGISKSQVSKLAASLDDIVADFRSRPLDQGPYTYLWLDALVHKVREGGRTVSVAAVVAIGVNADGHREVLGTDVITVEDGAGWVAFLRSLKARGLAGVQLVISDDHTGLVEAIASVLGASWQRCRTHFARNVLTRVPKAAQGFVAAAVRSIFEQADADEVRAQHDRVVEQVRERFPDAAKLLEEARDDVLAFAAFPRAHWRQIWSNNPLERLNKEIRRRTDVVGIFPNRGAVVRLVGAVLAEQNDEWLVARRYMGVESLTRARMNIIEGEKNQVEEQVKQELEAAI
jgi:putative transposase